MYAQWPVEAFEMSGEISSYDGPLRIHTEQWPVEAFEMSGEISSYDGRGFCPRCGSRLLDTADLDNTLIEIRIGSLDEAPFELKPEDRSG